MRVRLTAVMVDDQAQALQFYTEKLGFTKKHDVPVGADRWLTVISPQDPDGPELALHPQRASCGQAVQRRTRCRWNPLHAARRRRRRGRV